MKINGNLSFHNSATDFLRNVKIEQQDMGATPASYNATNASGESGGDVLGRILYNTNAGAPGYYYYDGTEWVAFATGGNAAELQAEVDRIESASGLLFSQNGNGSTILAGGWDPAPLSGSTYLGSATDLANALLTLDDVLSADAAGDVLVWNGSEFLSGAPGSAYNGLEVGTSGQITGTGVAAYDAGMADLAGVTGLGFIVQASADNFEARLLNGTAPISIADPDGSDGNVAITFDIGSLTALTSGNADPAVDAIYIRDADDGGDPAHKKMTLNELADAIGAATTLGELSDVTDNQTSSLVTTDQGDGFGDAYTLRATGASAYEVRPATLGTLNNVAQSIDGLTGASTEDVLAFDGTQWTAITVATMLSDGSILNLSDTPSSFGTAGQYLAVNGTTDGMEFVSLTGSGAAQAYDETLQAISNYNFGTDGGLIIATDNSTTGVAAVDLIADLDVEKKGIVITNGDLASTADIEIGLTVNTLTDLGGAPASDDELVIYDLTATENKKVTIGDLADGVISTGINLGDLADVDGTTYADGTSYIMVGDSGGNVDIVALSPAGDTPASFVENIEDIVGAMGVNGSNTTFTYSDPADPGTIKWEVNDVFISNTGDSFGTGSGTEVWTVQNGATFAIANGGSLTIADQPTNGTDAANKDYVDSIAAGLDPKESVRVATTANIDVATGGLLSIDGVTLVAGDRVLVKDQTTTTENGIYVVAAGAWSRAPDHDGTPSSEVSGGNHTFVEAGTTNGDTGWVLVHDGEVSLGTDPVVWSQFSGAGNFTAGLGLDQQGTTIFVKSRELTSATIVGADLLAFSDDSVTPSGTDGGDRVTTVTQFISDLGLLTSDTGGNAILATDGVLISGQTVELDIDGLSNVQSDAADVMVFGDATDGGNGAFGDHIKRTVTEFIADHSILTGGSGGSLTATDGVRVDGNDIELDLGALTANTITGADALVFNQGNASGEAANHRKVTASDFMDQLDIVHGADAVGFLVVTDATSGAQAYEERLLNAAGAGALAGLSIDDPDGSAGNVTFGLDIQNLAVAVAAPEATDTIAVFDGTNNEAVSMTQLKAYIGSATNIGDLNDVDTTGATNGNVLQYNGSAWVDVSDEFSVDGDTGSFNVGLGDTIDIVGGTLCSTAAVGGSVTINVAADTNDLGDVSAAPTESGQVMVSTGTSYTPGHISYVHTEASAATTWTVSHSLGQKFVNVTVYDSSDEVIIPQSITATDANTTTITFNTAITGTAVVMGVSGAPTN